MKKNRVVLKVSSILFLVVAVTSIAMNLALAFILEEYYPLDEGNSWTYLATKDEINYEQTVNMEGREVVEGVDTVRMVTSEDSYECVAIDTEGIKKYKRFTGHEYAIYNPARLIFSNLGIGEEKEYSTTILGYGVNGEKEKEVIENGQIKLEAVEDVEVPAGKFTDCLKFSLNYRDKEIVEKNEVNCTVWFAPGVGKIKESCLQSKTENGQNKISSELQLKSAIINGREIKQE